MADEETLTSEEETAVQETDAALEPVPEPEPEPASDGEPEEPTGDLLYQHPNGSFEVRVLNPIRNEAEEE